MLPTNESFNWQIMHYSWNFSGTNISCFSLELSFCECYVKRWRYISNKISEPFSKYVFVTMKKIKSKCENCIKSFPNLYSTSFFCWPIILSLFLNTCYLYYQGLINENKIHVRCVHDICIYIYILAFLRFYLKKFA